MTCVLKIVWENGKSIIQFFLTAQGTPGLLKLDRIGAVDNRLSTNRLHHFVKKNKQIKHVMSCDTLNVTHDMLHLTCDMWHMTCDTWHVTLDTGHMICDMLFGWTFTQNVSAVALTVCDLSYFEDLEEKADWLTDSHNWLITKVGWTVFWRL